MAVRPLKMCVGHLVMKLSSHQMNLIRASSFSKKDRDP